jgi:hypothetical protein
MRVAVTDNAGRSGAADVPIDAHLTPVGPLKISDIVLGTSARGEGGFQPRLQFTDQQPVATAYLEIYGGKPDQQILVFFDVSRTETGQPLMPPTQPSIEPSTDPDRFLVMAAIPIANLEPGDYAVRAHVYIEQKTTVIVRTLRKAQR